MASATNDDCDVDKIIEQNKVIRKVLLQHLGGKQGDQAQPYQRFLRLAEFYGLAGANKNLLLLFHMILDEPDKFKDIPRIIKKWTTASSVKSVLGTFNKVYEINEIKEMLGDKHEAIVAATKAFVKEAEAAAAAAAKNSSDGAGNAPAKKTLTKKTKAESVASASVVSDERSNSGDGDGDTEGGDDYGEDGPDDDGSSQGHQHSEMGDNIYKDMVDLKQRLILYCDSMADIDHHTVKTIVKCIRFDIDRYLADFKV